MHEVRHTLHAANDNAMQAGCRLTVRLQIDGLPVHTHPSSTVHDALHPSPSVISPSSHSSRPSTTLLPHVLSQRVTCSATHMTHTHTHTHTCTDMHTCKHRRFHNSVAAGAKQRVTCNSDTYTYVHLHTHTYTEGEGDALLPCAEPTSQWKAHKASLPYAVEWQPHVGVRMAKTQPTPSGSCKPGTASQTGVTVNHKSPHDTSVPWLLFKRPMFVPAPTSH